MSAVRSPSTAPTSTWVRICAFTDIERERGCAALIAGEQIAIFRTHDDHLYALQQLDPYSGASVMSRGIVGTRSEVPTVASPMYKQVFDLRTGECLDSQGKALEKLRTYPITVDDGGAVLIQWEETRWSR
ncbi:MAG: nitrite reductase small subunit NirD [Actinobacteria bacterium]|nr:nitrite reductase small subunit NirD [Actinomycetota bacterium]